MDRKQVERFLAVVENGSMTAAAKALFLNQASVSASIRELESEVGAELFLRGDNPLELTEAGRALVQPAIQILRSFSEAKSAIKNVAQSGLSGQLYIGCSAAAATAPAFDLIAEFCSAHPQVELRCEEVPPGQEAFELLRNGRLELIMHSETPRRDLHRTLFAVEQLYAVLPPGVETDRDEMAMEDVTPFDLVASHTVDPSSLFQAAGEVATAKADYRLAAVCHDRRMVAGLVMRGIGASIMPESLALELQRRGAVVRPMAWPARQAWVYHREGPATIAASRFLELAASAGAAVDS